MTLEYFDRWAAWPPSSIAADVAGLQWSHSILQEPFYKSPWQASEDAMHLAFTMQPNSFIQQCERREWGFSVPHRKIKKGLTVSFDPIAHVHFGPESSSSWTTSRVSIDDVSHREWLPKSRAFSQSNCNVVEVHTSSQQLLTLSRTAPISHRPDPTENPNLPDPPSSSEESTAHGGHGRIPIRHLPAWVETLWNILQDEGATELLEGGPIIYLSTYYLSHRTCVRQAADRPIRLTRRYEEWIEEFKSVWGDLFDREADFNVYLVQPEPPISLTRGIVGIVLIVQHAQPGGHAILTTALFDELPTPRTAEIAHVVDTWTDYSTVLHRAEAFEACREAERQGFPPCVLRAGPHVFPRERPIRMHDGLGLVVNVPMIINDEEWNVYVRPRMEQWQDLDQPSERGNMKETEDTALMARRPIRRTPTSSSSSISATDTVQRSTSREPSSGTSTWIRTVVFTLDGLAVSCLLPEDQNAEYYRRIAIAVNQDDIAETFIVLERPEDLVSVDLQCLLALRQGERRPVSFLRITLLDLEIFEMNEILPGAFRRLAKWLPHTTTMTSLFRILNIEDVYIRHPTKTHLWINNVLIDHDREGPMIIEDGDYIKIFIGDDERRFHCSAHSDEMNFLQIPGSTRGPVKTKIGDKHIVQPNRLDICDGRPTRRPRLQRDLTDEVDPDLRHLHDLWNRPQLQTRGPDREPIMYFDTWFLSALDFPRCSTPRLAALPANVRLWETALRQVWRDRQHPHWPIRMQIIHPRPVGAVNGGHLLILEHEHPAEAGILLTIAGGPAPDRFAQLVPSLLPFDRLLWFADQEVRCMERQWNCHATHNQQQLSTQEPWRADNGQHIELHVRRRPESFTLGLPELPRAEVPQPLQPTNSIDDFVLDPRAPEFVPHEIRLEAMPEVIQDLHEEWTRTVFSWQGEEPSAEVTTWFVDQHDPAHRVCWHPRNIQLTSQFVMWERNIRQLWQDRLINGAPSELVIVQPRPPQRGRPVAAHVLLVQRPQPELVTSVITVFDHVIPLPGPLWQLALTTNEHIFLEQIIHSLELTNRCLLAGADRHCFGWYGTHHLILGQPLQGRDGYSINLQMTARYTSVSIPQGESEQPPSQRTPAATHHHPARAEQVIRNASFERDREETPTASTL